MKKTTGDMLTPGDAPSPCNDTDRATPGEMALHNNFVASARALRRGMARTLYYLLAIKESKVYATYGFSNLEAYAEYHGGLAPRTVAEMLTLARRMQHIPELADAVQLGRLTWRKALLISRRAMESNPRPLIRLAEDLSYRELQVLARAKPIPAPVVPETRTPSIAELPTGPPESNVKPDSDNRRGGRGIRDPDCGRETRNTGESRATGNKSDPNSEAPIYVTLKMTPEQYALWESATAGPGTLVDRVLAAVGGQPAAQPRHLVVILRCPRCESGELVTSRGDLRAPASLLQRAMCDGIVEDESGSRRSRVSERRRRAVLRRARFRCEADRCGNTLWLEVHHRVPASQGGTSGISNLVVLCSGCHRRIHEREQRIRETVRNEP